MTEDTWRTSVEKRLANLEKDKAVRDVVLGNLEARLASIEGSLKWLVRLIIGALLTALVAFILNGGLQLAA